jgi:hypothetical protein
MTATPTLAPGVYPDIPADQYHADALQPEITLSSTLARLIIDRSPRHGWTAHPRLNPAHEPDNRKTFDIGRAAHRAVLGKGGAYVAYPPEVLASNGAASTKEAKAWADAVRRDGGTPLKADEVDQIGAIADSVRDRLTRMGITFDPSRSELTALAEVDGVWCRAMVDNAPTDPRLPLYDFKTTTDASPEGAVKAVVNYGYDVQAAFYLDAWRAATGENRRFRFVLVEKEAPFEVAVVELYDHDAMVAAGKVNPDDADSMASDWMAHARSKAREARRIWGECIAAGQWPGYPARVAMIGQPGWHGAKWDAREIGMPVIQKPKPSAEVLRAAMAAQAPERKAS